MFANSGDVFLTAYAFGGLAWIRIPSRQVPVVVADARNVALKMICPAS